MPATLGQLTANPSSLFVTRIKKIDGSVELVLSTGQLVESSVPVYQPQNRGTLTLLRQLFYKGNFTSKKAPLLNMDIWDKVFAWIFGIAQRSQLELIGNYPRALQLDLQQSPKPRLFSQMTNHRPGMGPYIVIDAVMRGEEALVMNILKADSSYLLRKAKIENSVDVEYEVTPLEAAVMTTDVQMIKRMKTYFEALTEDLDGNSINGLAEFHRQMKQAYQKSLQRYCDIQQERIDTLKAQEVNEETIDTQVLETAQTGLVDYKSALKTDNLNVIFKAHKQAQIDNAFDFGPYVDAILSASDEEVNDVIALINAMTPEETEAAVAKGVSSIEISFTDQQGKTHSREAVQALPFSQLTLIQKMNRFREKFTEYMQQEMIFNPNHILTGFTANLYLWYKFDIDTQDPDLKKRCITWSQLVGWAQRKAAEPVKQDIRQGTYYLTKFNEPRARPARFNDLQFNTAQNSLDDVSLSSISIVDGIGYKLASSARVAAGWPCMSFCEIASNSSSELISRKDHILRELIQRSCHHAESYDCCAVM